MKSRWLVALPVLLVVAMYSSLAMAETGQAADAGDWMGMVGMGAGLAIGLAVLGAGIGQGLLAMAALQGMARNPQAAGKIQISMLLAIAFPESLALFALVIAYMLAGKLG